MCVQRGVMIVGQQRGKEGIAVLTTKLCSGECDDVLHLVLEGEVRQGL